MNKKLVHLSQEADIRPDHFEAQFLDTCHKNASEISNVTDRCRYSILSDKTGTVCSDGRADKLTEVQWLLCILLALRVKIINFDIVVIRSASFCARR